jgi:hypothetical protein
MPTVGPTADNRLPANASLRDAIDAVKEDPEGASALIAVSRNPKGAGLFQLVRAAKFAWAVLKALIR